MALQSGEREVGLSTRGRAYTIDFTAMQQIDDDTGSPSKVLRQEKVSSHHSNLLAVFVCLLITLCSHVASNFEVQESSLSDSG
jgi:hypothetical protein